jgi:hypothetical protein
MKTIAKFWFGVMMIASLMLSGCKTQEFIDKINAALTAPTFNQQRLRAIQINRNAIANIQSADIAVGLSRADVLKFEPLLLAALRASPELKGANIEIGNKTTFSVEDGGVKVQVQFSKETPQARIELLASGMALVSASNDTIFVAVNLHSIKIDGIQLHGSIFKKMSGSLDALMPEMTRTIYAARTLINGVIEREFNEKDASRFHLVLPQLVSQNLGDLSRDGGFVLADKRIDLYANIVNAAVLVDHTGIFLIANAENKKPDTTSASSVQLPSVDGISPTDDEVHRAYSDAKTAFSQLHVRSMGESSQLPFGPTYISLSKKYISETLMALVNQAPKICGSGQIASAPPPFGQDIKFPNLPPEECSKYAHACPFKDICSSPGQCKETVAETYASFCPGNVQREVCNDVVSWIPFVGNVLKKVCKVISTPGQVACSLQRSVVKEVSTPACVALRATQAADPLICPVANNLSKARCDAFALAKEGICSAEQGLRNIIEHNPVAHIEGSVKVNGSANACLDELEIPPAMTSATVRISGDARADVALKLQYENRIAPGIGICKVDWAETFQTQATAQLSREVVSFSISSSQLPDNRVALRFEAPDREVKLDLSPSPLETVFLKHPSLLVNCQSVLPAAIAFLAYDTVWNDKLKEISPYASGKGLPMAVKKFGFAVTLSPIRLGAASQPVLTLKPRWDANAVSYVQ